MKHLISFAGVLATTLLVTACGGGGGDSATPTPAVSSSPTPAPAPEPTPAASAMHYVVIEDVPSAWLREIALTLQNNCAAAREAQGLPAAPALTLDLLDLRIGTLRTERYIGSDRIASYKRSYEFSSLSEDCVYGPIREVVSFEARFANGRHIRWGRHGSTYDARLEETPDDPAALEAVVKQLAASGAVPTLLTSASDAFPVVDTGRTRSIAGQSCKEYEFPAQLMTECVAQVGKPVPMMGVAGQDNLVLAVKILQPGAAAGDPAAVDSTATEVHLSQPLDPSKFDPASL